MDNNKNTSRINRLIYRSWHRGCKETDIALGDYAKAHLAQLEEAKIDTYEQLLEEDDWEIWDWLTEKSPARPQYAALIADIRTHIQSAS